jgi:hypothetical protein
LVERRTFKTAMTLELWQRLKPLHHVALEMPEEARAKFVDEAVVMTTS